MGGAMNLFDLIYRLLEHRSSIKKKSIRKSEF
jgi:hypothetical protein